MNGWRAMNKSGNRAIDLGAGPVLAIVFITLKLCGVITWSWVWVLSPVWISLSLVAVLVVILVLQEQRRRAADIKRCSFDPQE